MTAVRLRHGEMDYLTIDIVRVVPTPSEVDELVRCYEIAGTDLFFETADHACGQHVTYSQRPDGPEDNKGSDTFYLITPTDIIFLWRALPDQLLVI